MTRAATTRHLFDRTVAPLYTGYFNLVMATGIVSNAFFLTAHRELSDALLVVAVVAFPLLLAALTLRALLYPRRLAADLVEPRLVFTFFTLVASADVLGVGLQLHGYGGVATVLWLGALALWVLLGYVSFSVLALVNNEDHGAEVVHGGWLLAIVGTESLVVLGAQLAPRFGAQEHLVLFAVYSLWGIGIVLYGIFVTLVTNRVHFLRLEPDAMGPLFWLVMGAAAISANAGATLIGASQELAFFRSLRPFVDGTTLIFWAWGTWWIPLLVVLGAWRHVVDRYPLRYHPAYWTLVFPLGMYTVATYRLAHVAVSPGFETISRVTIWVAFAAWLATLLGLVGSLRGGREVTPAP